MYVSSEPLSEIDLQFRKQFDYSRDCRLSFMPAGNAINISFVNN